MTNNHYFKLASAISVLNTYFKQPKPIQKIIKNCVEILGTKLEEDEIVLTLHTLDDALFGEPVDD